MQKYVQEELVNCLVKLAQEKVWIDCLNMTIAVYWEVKNQAPQKEKMIIQKLSWHNQTIVEWDLKHNKCSFENLWFVFQMSPIIRASYSLYPVQDPRL